ncbi:MULTISPECIES: DUF5610 domain-containing protein [Rheinheimera]|uniref:DUF5610 domain-containing protein n=1 Tax=Rheinheimera marina TaxID=1774958 RepID=A0ABV9JK49_9GAMM
MSSINSLSNSNAQSANSSNATEESKDKKLTGFEQSRLNKQQLNASIMESQLNLTTGDESNSLKLLYKTALEGINKELEEEFGPNAAQKIKQSEVDTSPEATADRIVSFATAFYQKYKEQTPDMTEEERLDKFLSIVGGGVDTGFKDARDILDGLGVLSGKVADDIDKTYSLIQDGFARFRESILNPNKDDELATEVAANTKDELTKS